ncbi:GAP family protein [Nocardia cyriacigeorgica]|uniref:GAP family protein n=1 Tax=Nocardia cyriacigeorgica TaxID=135487 RepID=UPI0018939200|nr:GAP family protein [Nocardia cyriacigeorgica]MBF6416151.1 GAP family protein [Nocardia cyriacigeorgica]
MGDLLIQLIPVMSGLVVTPGAIVGCVLLLHSRRPIGNALVFGAAFVVVYSLIAISALLGGASDPGATSKDVSHGAGLAVGLLFLAAGVWVWLRRPARRTNADEPPKLLRELESSGQQRVFVIGIALAVINPNMFLMMSGMATISSSHVSAGTALLATLLLLVAASLDFLIPIGVYLIFGERARRWLDALQVWMIRNTRLLSLAVLFGFGALFTARGIVELAR